MENKHLMHSQAFQNGIIKCSVMHSQAFENGIIKCSIKINNAFSAYIILTKLSNYITETRIVAYIMLKENRWIFYLSLFWTGSARHASGLLVFGHSLFGHP